MVFIALFIAQAAYAQSVTGIPFGGRVTAIQPCTTPPGILAYVLTAKGPFPVIWFAPNLPFLSHIPPHPGQYLLGTAASAPITCIFGFVPYGVGFPILYHGSSI